MNSTTASTDDSRSWSDPQLSPDGRWLTVTWEDSRGFSGTSTFRTGPDITELLLGLGFDVDADGVSLEDLEDGQHPGEVHHTWDRGPY